MDEVMKDLEEQSRATPISWEDLIENILDAYRLYVDDLSHAVQKDAIQNSVDARDPEADGLEITFKLTRAGGEKLIIEDNGTVGLTGRILREDEYEKDLPEEERWGRFEGMAFKRENPRALGARGQGKFIFVGMSKNKMIVYDTLRKDGVYRLGARHLGKILYPPPENEAARKKLKKYFPDLSPLNQAGARIIVSKPYETLKEAIKTGRFTRYIQTTWWPILTDPTYNVSILIKFDGKEEKVGFPEDLKFPPDDTKDVKVWIREWDPIRKGYKIRALSIRKLHLCWSEKPLAEDVKGIMVIRGGMVVERVPVSELMTGAPPKITDHIYGYVEGDEGVQFQLKTIEDPTHYKFRRKGGWGKKNIFGTMLAYVSEQLQQFAQKKLGLEKTKKIKDFASLLKRFNRIVRSLGISPFDVGVVRPMPPSMQPPSLKPIDLIFSTPEFPRSSPRVNYGEEIRNFRVNVANRTGQAARIRVRIYTEQADIVRDKILFKDDDIPPGETRQFGPFKLKITRKYTAGECRIKGLLNCLRHPDFEKGADLDKSTCRFWVEQNPPPGKGPFRDIVPVRGITCKIGGHEMRLDHRVDPHPEGGYVLKYNTEHPAYKEKCRTDEETDEYIIELMAKGLSPILIASDHELFRGLDDPHEIITRSSALCSEILAKYYR